MRTHSSVSRDLLLEAAPAGRSPGVSYGRSKCETRELLRRGVVCMHTQTRGPPNGVSPLEVADRVRALAGLSFVGGRTSFSRGRAFLSFRGPESSTESSRLWTSRPSSSQRRGHRRAWGIPARTPRILRTSRRADRTRNPHPPAASGTTRAGYQPSPAGSIASRSRASRIRGSIGFLTPVP